MKDVPGLDFGLLMAYLLPGFVGVFGLTYVSDWFNQVFNSFLVKDAAVGAAFIVSIAALAVGATISAVRDLLLDRLIYSHWARIAKPPEDLRSLRDAGVMAAYSAAINNIYRYAQFYGNMAIALLMLVVAKFFIKGDDVRNSVAVVLGIAAATIVLSIAHGFSLDQCNKTLHKIVQISEGRRFLDG